MIGRRDGLDVVAFDFDGVVCESVDVKTEAFGTLYAEHGEKVTRAVVAHHLEHGGVSRYEKIRYYEEHLLGRPADDAVVEAKAARFSELVVDAVIAAPLVPGALECLRALSGRCPLYVISGTPEPELRQIVAAKGLSGYFRRVLGSPTVKADHLRQIVTTHVTLPSRVVMVGDSTTDAVAADETGVRFVGIVRPGLASPFSARTLILPDLTDWRLAFETHPSGVYFQERCP
jgi:phosphoglycolate phosphatase-like HAD superfamily hydrolase